MRILVCTVVHIPKDARIYERQIGALLDAGAEVTYAAPWGDAGGSEEFPDGLRVLSLPRATGRERLTSIRSATKLLRSGSPSHDLVIIHDPDLLLAVMAARVRTPVVWDVHEDVAASLIARSWVPTFLRPLARVIVRSLERWAEGRCHVILAEEAYRGRFRKRHPVVPNVPIVPPAVDEPGDDRVVYLGRLSRARGVDELIALGRELAGEVTVEVVGDAEPDVADELRLAAERGDIRWLGFLPNRAALDRVSGSIAGLSLLHDLPNFHGSMPTKVLEYMACGVPVITTPLPLAERVVREADAGEVVPFGDVLAAANAVRALRDDRGRRLVAGRNARVHVSAHYSWQREGPRFVDLVRGWARVGRG